MAAPAAQLARLLAVQLKAVDAAQRFKRLAVTIHHAAHARVERYSAQILEPRYADAFEAEVERCGMAAGDRSYRTIIRFESYPWRAISRDRTFVLRRNCPRLRGSGASHATNQAKISDAKWDAVTPPPRKRP